MSASICYQAIHPLYLPMGAPQSFIDRMTNIFGEPPWVITDGDYQTLKGFAAGLDDMSMRKAAEALAEAGYQHGEIRVWAEY